MQRPSIKKALMLAVASVVFGLPVASASATTLAQKNAIQAAKNYIALEAFSKLTNDSLGGRWVTVSLHPGRGRRSGS